ncbi:4Fe-4S binding protein [bacterium]|nr:4Fe-4S binding protein [bacterium]
MIDVLLEFCDFCGTCVGVCPTDAITLEQVQLHIDSELCAGCGDCVDICPVGALERQA